MWPHNQSENASIRGMTGTKTSLERMTPAEIELIARRKRAMVVGEAVADFIVVVFRAIGWAARPLAVWWNRSQVYDELMSMDDRMLADIGIARGDVPAVAAGRYRGEVSGGDWLGFDRVRRMPRAVFPAAHNDHAAPPQVA